MATENGVAALGKVLEAHGGALQASAAAQAWNAWVSSLPLLEDKVEAKAVHAQLVRLLEASDVRRARRFTYQLHRQHACPARPSMPSALSGRAVLPGTHATAYEGATSGPTCVHSNSLTTTQGGRRWSRRAWEDLGRRAQRQRLWEPGREKGFPRSADVKLGRAAQAAGGEQRAPGQNRGRARQDHGAGQRSERGPGGARDVAEAGHAHAADEQQPPGSGAALPAPCMQPRSSQCLQRGPGPDWLLPTIAMRVVHYTAEWLPATDLGYGCDD